MNKIIFILLFSAPLFSSQFSVNSSFQGFTGVINTPNAQVTKEGHAVLQLNNQFDNNLKSYNYDKKDSSQKDYILGFGLFSFMEVQGRLSEAPGYHRDLSVNTKLQLPYHYKYLPDIAIGIQDLGGAANEYDNTYVVMDKQFWDIRASAGYGVSHNKHGKKRMDGLFGAIEFKAMNWLYLMAEDDAKEQHVGLRLEMPESWLSQFNVRGTIVQNLQSNEMSFALTVDIPLYHTSKTKNIPYRQEHNKKVSNNSVQQHIFMPNEEKASLHVKRKSENSLTSIAKKLTDFGFENVKIGSKNQTVYIQFENTIFDHTDLDAIGYVAGVVSMSDLKQTNYVITLLKNNLKIMTILGVREKFKNYIIDPSFSNEKALKDNITFSRDFDDSAVAYSEKKNSSFFIPRVELYPGLITAVGTEVGVFDYALSLDVNTYMNIYDGLVLSVLYEIPISHSDDFGKNGAFFYTYETNLKNRFVNIMAHQTLHVKNFINTLSIGKYKTDYLGAINQADYTTTSGEHAFRYTGGYFVEENDTSKERYFSLGTYRYAYAPMDTYLGVTYGKYWYGDVGVEFELKRFFGETSVAFSYKNTSLNGVKEEFAGIRISFPLTVRKLYKANYIQVKGKKDFTYKLRTTVNKADGTNTINNDFGRRPESDFEITSYYLNRDRLSGSYIKEHLDRLREAYIVFKE